MDALLMIFLGALGFMIFLVLLALLAHVIGQVFDNLLRR